MSSSDDKPPFDIANPATDNTDTPANVDLPPVPHAKTPLGPETIVTALLEFGFTFASGEESLPVDEQCEHLTIGSLRQLAAYLGNPTPEQNKKRVLLGKIVIGYPYGL